MTQIMLVGNPNCGKTTLFNALTLEHQAVGNWPGVTVEKKSGKFTINHKQIDVIDLPGVYSLAASGDGISQDVYITSMAVLEPEVDVFVSVIDACHLERHLYLTSQILELGRPVILVLNMMDRANKLGINIDIPGLSARLGIQIIPMQAHLQQGIAELQTAIDTVSMKKTTPLKLKFPREIQSELEVVASAYLAQGRSARLAFFQARRRLEENSDLLADVVMADTRYNWVHECVQGLMKKKSDARDSFTAACDRVLLHRIFALPCFFLMMYTIFFLALHVAGIFQDFFDQITGWAFVQTPRWLLAQCHAPDWLSAVFVDGVGQGLQTTLTFIPVLISMFFFLSLLEGSGYMARAAFVMDRLMRMLGLPGKAFVPMIIGFGCNVPAIMAARVLDSEKERVLTVLMSPFMSCSARLAIYAVFVTAFFPTGGQNVVFSLYLVGMILAMLTGLMLRKTVLAGSTTPFVFELPAYQRPSIRRLLKSTAWRLRQFVVRAGCLIIPVSVVLGLLTEIRYPIDSGESLLALFGKSLTPFFAPMGIQPSNWPATVSLITGIFAKEVVVGSLNHFYASMHPVIAIIHPLDGLLSVWNALLAIPQHLLFLPDSSGSMSNEGLSPATYGIMYRAFGGQIAAYAYLLFILLYIPCVSTMSAIRQETRRSWMIFSVVWSFFVAYAVSVLFYQCATVMDHPQTTLYWLLGFFGLIACTVRILHAYAKWPGEQNVIATA